MVRVGASMRNAYLVTEKFLLVDLPSCHPPRCPCTCTIDRLHMLTLTLHSPGYEVDK